MALLIDAAAVREIFRGCIWEDGGGEKLEVAGIINQYNLSLPALDSHLQQIGEIIANLRAEVSVKDTGDEYISFVSAYYDRNGARWTSDDAVIEQLIILGKGVEMLELLVVPREVEWKFFPNGNSLYRVVLRKLAPPTLILD